MKVFLVPSSTDGDRRLHYVTSYLLNENVAVDAGCLGLWSTPDKQANIRHVFLTHTHIDHIATLPVFVENVYRETQEGVTVYGSRAVLDALQKHVFNDVIWPDFIGMSTPQSPFLRLQEIHSGQPVHVAGLSFTPFDVEHVVPTQGFVIEDGTSTVAITSDTGPADSYWGLISGYENLRAVFVEATFPNALSELAAVSKHLTPQQVAQELHKLNTPNRTADPVRVIAVHLKAQFHDRVADELRALNIAQLEVGVPGQVYEF